MKNDNDTIAAIATPIGHGGIGIIRVSGSLTSMISYKLLSKIPIPRQAEYLPIYSNDGTILDKIIALFFPEPNSFTGEDVLEIHGHGSPIMLDIMLKNILQISDNIRIAHPGEFTARAFLNNKIDLIQAEAIADLINASSEQAAKSASSSLQGAFSIHINSLIETITKLRIQIEGIINFPEEDNNFLTVFEIKNNLSNIINNINKIHNAAQQGHVLQEGIKIVITGKPNAGKSSLFNVLSGNEEAIVTEIPGTTRDILHKLINIDGIPFHLADTAGLHDSNDTIEQIGIKRAWNEIKKSDHILYIVDATESIKEHGKFFSIFLKSLSNKASITIIRNKIDLTGEKTEIKQIENYTVINLSIKSGNGINLLRKHMKLKFHISNNYNEGIFLARRRHLQYLNIASKHLLKTQYRLINHEIIDEILAEELNLAYQALTEITGKMNSDELLGKIFSTFCIGK